MPTPLATFSDGTTVPTDGNFHVDPVDKNVSVRCLEFWAPPGVTAVVSGGNTARLGLLEDQSVLKYAFDRQDKYAKLGLKIEHEILSALGNHDRLVVYYGETEHGLRFRHEVNGDIQRYWRASPGHNVPLRLRLKWSKQAAEGLQLVHSKGVIHCDIHPTNYLLDSQLDVRLCDFSGSLFGVLDGGAMESVRFYLPREPYAVPTTKSDIFALGSTLYFIMTGCEPFQSLSDEEVSHNYARSIFPDVTSIVLGSAILACWQGSFHTAQQVAEAVSISSSEIWETLQSYSVSEVIDLYADMLLMMEPSVCQTDLKKLAGNSFNDFEMGSLTTIWMRQDRKASREKMQVLQDWISRFSPMD